MSKFARVGFVVLVLLTLLEVIPNGGVLPLGGNQLIQMAVVLGLVLCVEELWSMWKGH
jgi:hypothetical protein